jgi:hypothetical protein|tara:strand:- start:138 stop:299 length:162 start_codon:yes stop_codon:yes gene_type:complete
MVDVVVAVSILTAHGAEKHVGIATIEGMDLLLAVVQVLTNCRSLLQPNVKLLL